MDTQQSDRPPYWILSKVTHFMQKLLLVAQYLFNEHFEYIVNFELHVSNVNSDIWHRYWTSVENFSPISILWRCSLQQFWPWTLNSMAQMLTVIVNICAKFHKNCTLLFEKSQRASHKWTTNTQTCVMTIHPRGGDNTYWPQVTAGAAEREDYDNLTYFLLDPLTAACSVTTNHRQQNSCTLLWGAFNKFQDCSSY